MIFFDQSTIANQIEKRKMRLELIMAASRAVGFVLHENKELERLSRNSEEFYEGSGAKSYHCDLASVVSFTCFFGELVVQLENEPNCMAGLALLSQNI